MENFKNFISETVGKEQFDEIRNENRLLMEFVRGSTLYNLNNQDSDIDTGGVYICRPEEVLGFLHYKDQVSDSRHDNTWYEIGNFIQLLIKANPNILEALFVPDNKVIGEIHPLMKMLRDNKEEFVTKKCFNTFYGYAKSQIEKARGLNKKIVNPIVERKTPLDFTFTFYKQGSTKIENWLEYRGLKTQYCGLNNIPNMHDMYSLFYDYGNHCLNEPDWEHDKKFLNFVITQINPDYTLENIEDVEAIEYGLAIDYLKEIKPIGYRGLVCEKVENTTQLRVSSIPDKYAKPICHISFNQSGYVDHCKKYHDYKEWEKNRNPKRYESNLDKNYDSKNLMHCFRLIHMGKEIARGEGVKLERDEDRQFLMDVRNHKFEYDELMEQLNKEIQEMNELMAKSTIKEDVDSEKINKLLIDIRLKQIEDLRK